MRVPLVAAVALAVIGATLASRPEATATGPLASRTLPPVLGISYRSDRGTLAWFDPLTLRMLPGRKAPLGGHRKLDGLGRSKRLRDLQRGRLYGVDTGDQTRQRSFDVRARRRADLAVRRL